MIVAIVVAVYFGGVIMMALLAMSGLARDPDAYRRMGLSEDQAFVAIAFAVVCWPIAIPMMMMDGGNRGND